MKLTISGFGPLRDFWPEPFSIEYPAEIIDHKDSLIAQLADGRPELRQILANSKISMGSDLIENENIKQIKAGSEICFLPPSSGG